MSLFMDEEIRTYTVDQGLREVVKRLRCTLNPVKVPDFVGDVILRNNWHWEVQPVSNLSKYVTFPRWEINQTDDGMIEISSGGFLLKFQPESIIEVMKRLKMKI